MSFSVGPSRKAKPIPREITLHPQRLLAGVSIGTFFVLVPIDPLFAVRFAAIMILVVVVIKLGFESLAPPSDVRRPPLASRRMATESLNRAKDSVAGVAETRPLEARVAALASRLAFDDRQQLELALASALAAAHKALLANGDLNDEPSTYEPDQVSGGRQLGAIVQKYDELNRQAHTARKELDAVAVQCDQLVEKLAEVPTTLARAEEQVKAAREAYTAFQAEGFSLNLQESLDEAERLVKSARAIIAGGEDGHALAPLTEAQATCGRLIGDITAELRHRDELVARLACLQGQVDALTGRVAITADLLKRLNKKCGQSATKGLADKTALQGKLDELKLATAEAALCMDQQNRSGASEAMDEADVLVTQLNRLLNALASRVAHLDEVFATCEARIEELLREATQVQLCTSGNQAVFQARAAALVEDIAALQHELLAGGDPDYVQLRRLLREYRTTLAEIRDGSAAEQVRVIDSPRLLRPVD